MALALIAAVPARSGVGCQPRTTAGTCECASRGFEPRPTTRFPPCTASALCGADSEGEFAAEAPRSSRAAGGAGATVLIVHDHTPNLVKAWYRINPWKSYVNTMRLTLRLALSLRRVGTTLPITLWATGERHALFEERLLELGVTIFNGTGREYAVRRPAWANHHHYGSFQHLKVLALTRWHRLIMLDPDALVLRNIDHLAHAPAPAVVFRFKCFPVWEINGGVMVLAPSASSHARMQTSMNCSSWSRHKGDCAGRLWGISNDPSDQSVWRHFWPAVHELPVRFNAFKNANLSAAGWRRVSIVHDVDVLRRNPVKWPEPRVHALYRNLSIEANEELARLRARLGVAGEVALMRRQAQLEGCTRLREFGSKSPCHPDFGKRARPARPHAASSV